MSDNVINDVTLAKNEAIDEIAAKLQAFGASDEIINRIKNDLGVSSAEDLSVLTESDLITAGFKAVPARKLISSLLPAKPVYELTDNNFSFDGVLPTISDDVSWLEALKTGGVLNVDQSTIIAAIRAALADKVGLYNVPDKLADAMERFADNNDEQVNPAFFELRKQITQRSYADVFAAIKGLDGAFVTEARKKQLFERINNHLWPAIISFYEALKNWQEAWKQDGANSAMFFYSFANKGGAGVSPDLLQAPDTSGLRDQAEAVADAINKVFAGTGVQIASALAYDANRIKKTLEDNRLPAMVGAANRDQMLKQLNIAVNATYPRLETNITKFVVACIQAKNLPAGDEETRYFSALFRVGTEIQWSQLQGLDNQSLSRIGGQQRQL